MLMLFFVSMGMEVSHAIHSIKYFDNCVEKNKKENLFELFVKLMSSNMNWWNGSFDCIWLMHWIEFIICKLYWNNSETISKQFRMKMETNVDRMANETFGQNKNMTHRFAKLISMLKFLCQNGLDVGNSCLLCLLNILCFVCLCVCVSEICYRQCRNKKQHTKWVTCVESLYLALTNFFLFIIWICFSFFLNCSNSCTHNEWMCFTFVSFCVWCFSYDMLKYIVCYFRVSIRSTHMTNNSKYFIVMRSDWMFRYAKPVQFILLIFTPARIVII